MPIYEVEDPDTGLILELEGDSPPTEQELVQIFSQYAQPAQAQPTQSAPEQAEAPQGQYQSYKPQRSGIPDVVLSAASGIPAEIGAGLAGLASAPIVGMEEASNIVSKVRDFLTVEPQTEEGRAVMQAIGSALEPIARNLEGASQEMGSELFQATGSPAAGAYGATLPTALAEIGGAGLARSAGGVARRANVFSRGEADAEKAAIVRTGADEGVPVLNTDVNPPESYMGKLAQSLSEKAGVFGSGAARAKQQVARKAVIQGLADEFEVDLQSPFAEEIVKNLKAESARKMAAAAEIRQGAVDRLVEFGEVPATKAADAVKRQATKQANLKGAGSPEVVDEMRDYLSSVEGGDFEQFKNVRIELIRDIKALEKATDSPNAQRRLTALNSLKNAIDEDMSNFATRSDRKAASDWIKSNRQFADELTNTKQTELKRILQKGDATPETVLTILRAGKQSELKRLKSSIGQDGIKSARAAIVKDILDESGFFRDDINPNKVATSLGKTKRQQAISVFFDEADKTRLEGLRKLLDHTRRAQDFSINPSTGQQLVPFAGVGGFGLGMVVEPITAIASATSIAAIAKAYESKAMRNFLMRAGQSKPGSAAEKRLLDSAATALLAQVQASRSEQEKKQQ